MLDVWNIYLDLATSEYIINIKNICILVNYHFTKYNIYKYTINIFISYIDLFSFPKHLLPKQSILESSNFPPWDAQDSVSIHPHALEVLDFFYQNTRATKKDPYYFPIYWLD